MSDDVRAILERMRSELDEDGFRELANAVGVDPDEFDGTGSDVPQDATEAKDGEMKIGAGAAGKADEDRATPDDAVTEAELEEALADIRADAVTQEDLADVIEDLEQAAQKALMEELPGITEQVGQKMATGRGGSTYGGSITSTFAPAASPGPGRNPVARSRDGATAEKMNGSGEPVDYADAIEDAFSRHGGD